ncbi:MAG: ABC transporter ATP-binding protein [Anaerolineales bacterium]|nr:MAG: ABC transporter ATP-binding protein [Anaerolineales bacterium]
MKRTGQQLQALSPMSFDVDPGSFVTIVGPSGCGKSSLLKAVAGLIPAASGRVLLDGQIVTKPGKGRAMVFQSPALLPWRTVLKNVAYGLELQGVPPRQAQLIAGRYIAMVGLKGFEESYPNELSEGMRQRVNLARALATEPSLLLLDEPFASLDSQTRTFMQLELQALWQRSRSTALFVTHQITEAILLGDQVIVISARPGQIKEILPIPLERPRTLEMKRSEPFNRLEEHIWGLIERESITMRNLPLASDLNLA